MTLRTLTGSAVALALLAGWAQASPSDALWTAMAQVESLGRASAYNAGEGAAGIVQIRPVCLEDVNRIARLRGLAVRFSAAERFDPAKAREMWIIYLRYYGEKYMDATGDAPTDEVYARIWNGGPSGWKKAATERYWQRVLAAMPKAAPPAEETAASAEPAEAPAAAPPAETPAPARPLIIASAQP